jgi:hypothetical protein
MPKAPPTLTADLLVECVEHHSRLGARPVTSRDVKDRLDELGTDFGDPHGYRLRDAEDGEFASPGRRLVKWKKGAADSTQMVGYTLESDNVTVIPGWRKIRP